MRTVKTVRMFYLIYTIYTLFIMSVSNYKISHVFAGLLFLWLSFAFFKIGFKTKMRPFPFQEDRNNGVIEVSHEFPLASIQEWKPLKKAIISAVCWACAIMCARFYTGRNFISVISGILGGQSAYLNYQRYFSSSNISSFTFAKIPYIFMLAFLTIIMIWNVLSTLLCKKNTKWWDYIFLISNVASYLYFGLARGTNFETYVVFILFAYCLLQKANGIERRKKIKYITITAIIGIIMVSIYRLVLSDRGIEFRNSICQEILFNDQSFFGRYFPTLTNIAISLFSYLGYGIYTIGVTVSDICFESLSNLFGSFVPMGNDLIVGNTLEGILRQTIHIGVRWVPDYIKLIDALGLPLSFLAFLLLGRFTAKIYYGTYPELLKEVLHSIIFIEMLSLPVGNFILSSSSNEIMVLFALLWLVQDKHVVFRLSRRNVTGRQ